MAEITGPVSSLLRVHMQHKLSFPAALSSDDQKYGKLHLPTLSAIPCYSHDITQESSKNNHQVLGRDTVAHVVREAASAAVTIRVCCLGSDGIRTHVYGSGVVINKDGHVLTCSHVISQGSQIDVILRDDQELKSRLVVAFLDLDIALLKIDPLPKIGLSTAKVGSSGELHPGHWVIAIGCPLSLPHTVSLGIISFKCRKSSKLHKEGVERDFLQMDCSITQGNSGGPLFNIDGELVGINTHCSKIAPGMSFAIPVDNIRALLNSLSEGNAFEPEPGWIIYDLYGMMISQKDPLFPDQQEVRVLKVRQGSSAERAGVKPGDMIVEFDGEPTKGDIRQGKSTHISTIMDVLKERYGKPITLLVHREKYNPKTYTVHPEKKNHQAPGCRNVKSNL